jgi:benzoyl-CoA reductase/2-hydroxyglutaryl-CoA dehydratase subunit BcrC/BadD/HgdB
MKVETFDTTKFDRVVRVLDMLTRMTKNQAERQGEYAYYSLFANCLREIQQAPRTGRKVVAHSIFIPTEFFFALDIVPLYLEAVGELMARLLGLEESFATARNAGFANEICSGHRLLNAQAVKGWLPRPDAFAWSNLVCDVTAKTGDFLAAVYDRPAIYLDRPYRHTTESERYYIEELKDLITFLEGIAGKKMEPARLREAMEYTRQSQVIFREINEMRKVRPSPMRNRHLIEMILAQNLLSGSPQLVKFYETVRDEVKAELARPVRDTSADKHRLISFFYYPSYMWSLLDTLEKRFGAVVVCEPHLWEWAEVEIDPAKPLESLARKAFALDDTGPLTDRFLPKVLKWAEEYQADGALYWAHIGCRQTCPTMRIIKDELQDKLGIPTLLIDCDLADSTYSREEDIVKRVEDYFEMLNDS